MPELLAIERLQPCLLDRLRDDAPGDLEESRNQRVISLPVFREGVLRDLRWLLNTTPALSPEEAEQFPEARRSTLNYGVRDLGGMTSHDLDAGQLERQLHEAILLFEPRIDPRTVEVSAVVDEAKVRVGQLSFEIRGELWAKPLPDPLFVRTQMDLDTGDCSLG